MNRKKLLKKIFIASGALLFGAVLVTLILWGVAALLSEKVDSSALRGETGVSLADADYDEDIFFDASYTSKNRNVYFTFDGDSEYITSDNYSESYVTARMFYDYFQAVINGDYSVYPSFFTDSFFNSYTVPEIFTMQKIYDISVTLESRTANDTGWTEMYSVRYRFMDNNGTFRSDLPDNTIIPVYYSITVSGDTALINAMYS
ncbi:MAG: hypothetical protein ACI3W9_04420 [Eubacteriales bacterium]